MRIKTNKHITVFLNEAVNSLNIKRDGIYIDGTFGYGGHSRLILSHLGENGRLLAIDRDPEAITIAKKTINDPRFSIIHGPFSKLIKYAEQYKIKGKISGILLDLGLSSLQLKNTERGFSFSRNGPLDMRMDPTQGQSAAEWINTAEESEIAWVLKNFGEERFHKKIAHAIKKHNRKFPLLYTQELVKIIIKTIPSRDKFKHPATRTFQAVRIKINNEIQEIKLALKSSLDVLAPNGILSVISFHSLESRIIKEFMRDSNRSLKNFEGCSEIMKIKKVLQKNNNSRLKEIGKLLPSKEEIMRNTCSRSAILRFAKKIVVND